MLRMLFTLACDHMTRYDRENELSALNPTIRWVGPTGDTCLDYVVTTGTVNVPSSYQHPKGKRFNVGLRRVTLRSSTPTAHMIFIGGGPGASVKMFLPLAEQLIQATHGDLAVYMIDHRGMETSGSFVNGINDWELVKADLKNMVQNSPMDISDLTIENAALDIGMLALALKRSSWTANSKLALYGYSYGSMLGQHVVELLPQLFDGATLGGMMNIGPLSQFSFNGILEHCLLDDVCRERMGGNLKETFPKMVADISNPKFNECTRILHDALKIDPNGTQGERVVRLGWILQSISIHQTTTILPTVKATYDCIDPKKYAHLVVDLLRMDKLNPTGYITGLDPIVNTVVLLSVYGQDYRNDSFITPANLADLHPAHALRGIFYDRFKILEPYLKNRRLIGQNPLKTTKTIVNVASSRLDIRTPYHPAWHFFERIEASKKNWLLYEHRTHDGYTGVCMTKFILMSIYDIGEFDYDQCIRDEPDPHNWSRNNALMSTFWEYVKSEPKSEYKRPAVPTSIINGRGTKPMPSGWPVLTIVAISGGLILVVIIGVIVWRYYKWRAGKVSEASRESACAVVE